MTPTPTPVPPAAPARCGGCGGGHQVSPTTGYCPRCTHQVQAEAARHVAAHPTRRPAWPTRWSP